jgi:hypothetical protein
MRGRILGALALLLVALPCSALGATPSPLPGPSAADVRAVTPGLSAGDATCIANYYGGRLTRKAWLTPYYKLTRAEKLVTDKGFAHCMTLPERTALIVRQDTLSLGKHPAEVQCSAAKMAGRSDALLLSITTLEGAIREDDRVYRGCHLIGVLYEALAKSTQLRLTPAEQACANRVGSADPLRSRRKKPTVPQRAAIGTVFDRCVGAHSKTAMWMRLLKDFRPSKAVACIAKRSVAITFVTFFSDSAGLQRAAKKAAAHCVLSGGK